MYIVPLAAAGAALLLSLVAMQRVRHHWNRVYFLSDKELHAKLQQERGGRAGRAGSVLSHTNVLATVEATASATSSPHRLNLTPSKGPSVVQMTTFGEDKGKK